MTPRKPTRAKGPRKPTRAKGLGVSDAEYARLLEAQGGHCALCSNVPKTRRLHVDHDHATGRVRGLLCYRCNRALPSYVTAKWLGRAMHYVDPSYVMVGWPGTRLGDTAYVVVETKP